MTKTTSPAKSISHPFTVKLYRAGRYIGEFRTRTVFSANIAVWRVLRSGKVGTATVHDGSQMLRRVRATA